MHLYYYTTVQLLVVLLLILKSAHGFLLFPSTPPTRTITTTSISTASTTSKKSPPALLIGSSFYHQHHDPRTTTTSTQLHGIPKMFRWLTDQYPDILERQVEQGLLQENNSNADCFYLDLNGIIHPATHNNNQNSQEVILLDETAMFKKIFLYIDKMYKLVKPTKLLYLAVDGVAPRAKMNQQRARRFRSAKEAEQMMSERVAQQNAKGKSNNNKHQEDHSDKERFDSNCITPGTDFMLKLSMALSKWVEYKMQTDPFWSQNTANVLVSGPDVPGEGEHKVMDFIRDTRQAVLQSNQDDNNNNKNNKNVWHQHHWQPNYTHVLYGLDADLIMLGLVTHEPNFMLLREKMSVVMAGRRNNRKRKDMLDYTQYDFELLQLSSLRQMLALQFRSFADRLKETYDLERIIDDFVFMCMLVGNDFLPHCPHLEIDGGAISMMMSNYVDSLEKWGGYLTKKEKIHPERFEQFMYSLAIYEEEHFKRRGFEENESGWKLPSEEEKDPDDFYGTYYSGKPTPKAARGANRPDSSKTKKDYPAEEDRPMAASPNRAFRRQHSNEDHLHACRSYRDFYYATKLGWKVSDRSRTLYERRFHVRSYLEGLHWNLNYYHNGCASWDWYFPYLYAPLATDMVNLLEFYDSSTLDEEGFGSFSFEKGTPFPSLAQLLSVLPPQSAGLLPKVLSKLMLDPVSPLYRYYPSDFVTDPNGKRQSWEAVIDLPFLDADLLLETVERTLAENKNALSNAEERRNMPGEEKLFVSPVFREEEGRVGVEKAEVESS